MTAPTTSDRSTLAGLLADARPFVEPADPGLAAQMAGAEGAGADELTELLRRARFHVSRGDMTGHLLARLDRVLFG